MLVGSSKNWTPFEKMPVCSMRTALTHFLDVTTPPTQTFLQLLATLATRDMDKDRLEQLAKVLGKVVLTGNLRKDQLSSKQTVNSLSRYFKHLAVLVKLSRLKLHSQIKS